MRAFATGNGRLGRILGTVAGAAGIVAAGLAAAGWGAGVGAH
jgi:hypothetical protein